MSQFVSSCWSSKLIRSHLATILPALALSLYPYSAAAAPLYEERFDLNRDAIIDTQDMHILAVNMGAAFAGNRHMDFDKNTRVDAMDLSLIAQRNGARNPADTALTYDVNSDGTINSADMSALATHLFPKPYQARYDYNQDSRIDALDLGALAQRLVSITASTPPGASRLFAPAQTVEVDVAARIGAYIDMGGSNANPNRQLSYAVDSRGWAPVRQSVLEPLAAAGVRRVELHNVFGRKSRIAAMDFPIADELRALPALLGDFVSEFSEFYRRNPQIEGIAYLGSPYKTPALGTLESNPALWWDAVYDTLELIFQAGFKSIGFDASGSPNILHHPLDLLLHEVLMNPGARNPVRDRRLIALVGSRPVRVYYEATPKNGTDPRTGRYTNRSELGHNHMIITSYDYYLQNPESPTTHASRKRHSERYGEMEEIAVMVRHEICTPTDPLLPRANCLNAVRSFLDEPYGNVTTLLSPRYLINLPGNQRAKGHSAQPDLASFIRELNLTSLPVRVDLDPDDKNPVAAEFRVVRGPLHGTFQMSSDYADVLVYAPAPNFKGADYLDYSVSTADRSAATGRITFNVR
jgi:hypothetical protein